jgi:hypothetical protein
MAVQTSPPSEEEERNQNLKLGRRFKIVAPEYHWGSASSGTRPKIIKQPPVHSTTDNIDTSTPDTRSWLWSQH